MASLSSLGAGAQPPPLGSLGGNIGHGTVPVDLSAAVVTASSTGQRLAHATAGLGANGSLPAPPQPPSQPKVRAIPPGGRVGAADSLVQEPVLLPGSSDEAHAAGTQLLGRASSFAMALESRVEDRACPPPHAVLRRCLLRCRPSRGTGSGPRLTPDTSVFNFNSPSPDDVVIEARDAGHRSLSSAKAGGSKPARAPGAGSNKGVYRWWRGGLGRFQLGFQAADLLRLTALSLPSRASHALQLVQPAAVLALRALVSGTQRPLSRSNLHQEGPQALRRRAAPSRPGSHPAGQPSRREARPSWLMCRQSKRSSHPWRAHRAVSTAVLSGTGPGLPAGNLNRTLFETSPCNATTGCAPKVRGASGVGGAQRSAPFGRAWAC